MSAPAVTQLAVSLDGERLYAVRDAGGGDAELVVIDPLAAGIGPTMPIRGLVTGLVPSPDGLRLYVAHRFYSGLVSIVDLGARRVTDELPLKDGATALTITHDGTCLVVPNGGSYSGRLTLLDAMTKRPRTDVELPGADVGGVAITADGERAFVASFQTGSVAMVGEIGRAHV